MLVLGFFFSYQDIELNTGEGAIVASNVIHKFSKIHTSFSCWEKKIFKLISRLETARGYLYLNSKKIKLNISECYYLFKHIELTQMKLVGEKQEEMLR